MSNWWEKPLRTPVTEFTDDNPFPEQSPEFDGLTLEEAATGVARAVWQAVRNGAKAVKMNWGDFDTEGVKNTALDTEAVEDRAAELLVGQTVIPIFAKRCHKDIFVAADPATLSYILAVGGCS